MIWVVLPIYNEEGVIAKFIRSIQRELNKAHLDFSLIAVNDGSDDKSEVILNDLAKELSVHLIKHPKNQVLGETIRDGLLFASERSKEDDWIVTMDADNTHPPEYIPKLLEKGSQGYNLIIASRYQKGAKEEGLSLLRSLYSRALSTILRMRFPIKGVRDYSCGYRLYSAKTLKRAFSHYGEKGLVCEKGFLCMAEILLKMRRLNLKANEIGFTLRYDRKEGPSKMKVLKTILSYFRLLVTFKGDIQ